MLETVLEEPFQSPFSQNWLFANHNSENSSEGLQNSLVEHTKTGGSDECEILLGNCASGGKVALAHASRSNVRFPHDVVIPGDLEVTNLVWQTLRERIPKCHFVIVTADARKSFILQVIRRVSLVFQSLILVDIGKLVDGKQETDLISTVLGISTTTCRTLLIDLTSGGQSDMFRLLESAKLYLWPESRIIIVGSKTHEERVLKDHVFRNSLRVLFLSIPKSLLARLAYPDTTWTKLKPSKTTNNETLSGNDTVILYGLCLFCDEGKPSIRLVFSWWPPGTALPKLFDPFPDQLDNMRGHLLRVVGMTSFPYNDYIREEKSSKTKGSQTKVIWLDSLDKRMYALFSKKLNFTYTFGPPEDGQFGIYVGNGNWSGLVGEIQHNKADITTIVAPSSGRNQIFDHMRAYVADPFTVVSLKPQLLSQYTLILRPFTSALTILADRMHSDDNWLHLVSSFSPDRPKENLTCGHLGRYPETDQLGMGHFR
ncbi:hypothetical protein SK128_005685 [Halocaridina rubra]|uniref:Ionotropic glutamate receptor L-glutamate and glycine-binding domain-containing protein n=1 Tax=Halocaridina rubra TaxID=373956 RepID=A0AAN8WQW9_HALRR